MEVPVHLDCTWQRDFEYKSQSQGATEHREWQDLTRRKMERRVELEVKLGHLWPEVWAGTDSGAFVHLP